MQNAKGKKFKSEETQKSENKTPTVASKQKIKYKKMFVGGGSDY